MADWYCEKCDERKRDDETYVKNNGNVKCIHCGETIGYDAHYDIYEDC